MKSKTAKLSRPNPHFTPSLGAVDLSAPFFDHPILTLPMTILGGIGSWTSKVTHFPDGSSASFNLDCHPQPLPRWLPSMHRTNFGHSELRGGRRN